MSRRKLQPPVDPRHGVVRDRPTLVALQEKFDKATGFVVLYSIYRDPESHIGTLNHRDPESRIVASVGP
jgi:hypothetical protein